MEAKVKLQTRLADHRVEFQICLTPKVADRTVLDWSRDLDHLFNDMIVFCDSHKLLRNLPQSVRKDPNKFFGIFHPQVQARVSDPPLSAPNFPQASGVLACSNGVSPTLSELKTYMGLHPTRDANLDWLVQEMLCDPLPPGYTQHVSRNSTYWTVHPSDESTWKHPHFDKYSHYIKCARNFDSDDRVLFQLDNRPPDTGITGLIEIARIYKVRLDQEPFLVHAFSDPDSIDWTNQRIKTARQTFENVYRLYRSIHAPVCSECDKDWPAQFCFDCDDYFCEECFTSIHDSGKRITHRRLPFRSPICSECTHSSSSVLCTNCSDSYCFLCFKHIHARGGRRYHVPVVLLDMSSNTTCDYSNNIKEKYSTMKSPWIVYNGVYYNVENNFEHSSIPPSHLNTPV